MTDQKLINPANGMPMSARPDKCGTCRFADKTVGTTPEGRIVSELECRRHPPAMHVVAMQQTPVGPLPMTYSAFTKVQAEWWCGDWQSPIAVRERGRPVETMTDISRAL